MNKRDELILNALRKNPKISIRELAEKINIPVSTIHRRLRALETEGVIKGYKLLVDWEKIGKPIGILVFIDVIPEKRPLQKPFLPLKKVESKLKKLEEVEEILLTEGERDIVVKARLENLKKVREFLDRIRNIPGVAEIESCIIIEETVR